MTGTRPRTVLGDVVRVELPGGWSGYVQHAAPGWAGTVFRVLPGRFTVPLDEDAVARLSARAEEFRVLVIDRDCLRHPAFTKVVNTGVPGIPEPMVVRSSTYNQAGHFTGWNLLTPAGFGEQVGLDLTPEQRRLPIWRLGLYDDFPDLLLMSNQGDLLPQVTRIVTHLLAVHDGGLNPTIVSAATQDLAPQHRNDLRHALGVRATYAPPEQRAVLLAAVRLIP